MKIKFLFPKNYKHGLLLNDFYSEIVEVEENIDLYKRFDFDGFIDTAFKKTSIWTKLNHFSFIPYLKWKRIFNENNGDYDFFVYQATSIIKIIYKNYELNYLHNPIFKEVIFDFYLVHGINIKIKKKDINLDDHIVSVDFGGFTKFLFGDYCIDISDYDKISDDEKKIRDLKENPFQE